MGGTESAGDYWRSEEKNVMIRAFDFTAKDDTTYRYRVRIVVFNPNKSPDDIDISKAVDNRSDERRAGRGARRPTKRTCRPMSCPM